MQLVDVNPHLECFGLPSLISCKTGPLVKKLCSCSANSSEIKLLICGFNCTVPFLKRFVFFVFFILNIRWKKLSSKKQTKTGRLFSLANTALQDERSRERNFRRWQDMCFFQNLPFKECIFTLLDLVRNVSSQLEFSPSQSYCFIPN